MRAHPTLAGLGAVTILFCAGQALAQTAAPEPTAPVTAPATARWYGGQTLMADAGGIGLITTALALDAAGARGPAVGGTFLLGVGGLLLGGPVVHAVHGRWGRAGASLALRVGLPILGWAAGFGIGRQSCGYEYDHEGGPTDYANVGVLFGALAAIVVDSAVLARF